MVKRILLSIVLLLVIAYLVVAVTAFNRKPTSQVCQDVELVIKDTVYAGFITKKEVATLLEKKGISPIGKDLERVRTKTLERELAKHPLIDQVECYKTPSGKLCIEVTQRTPILRVMSANGLNLLMRHSATTTPSGSAPTNVVTNTCSVSTRPEPRSSSIVANSMKCLFPIGGAPPNPPWPACGADPSFQRRSAPIPRRARFQSLRQAARDADGRVDASARTISVAYFSTQLSKDRPYSAYLSHSSWTVPSSYIALSVAVTVAARSSSPCLKPTA